jgi:hypothetical protein
MAGDGAGASWTDQVDLDRFWRYAKPVAVAGLVVSSLVAAASFLQSPPPIPSGLTLLLLLGVFPVHLGTVLSLKRAGGRSPVDLLRAVPPAIGALGAAFILVAWLVAATAMAEPGGSVEKEGDEYTLNDHGERREISRDEYLRRRASGQRVSGATTAVLYAAAVVAGMAHPRLRPAGPPDGRAPATSGDPEGPAAPRR